jgi:Signal transduction histidine kinase
MSLKSRFATLLGLIVGLFLGSVFWQDHLARRGADEILRTTQAEREQLLAHVLTLLGASLETFARDYSLWDDMIEFAQNPHKAWASINIDASLPTFNAVGAWVFKLDGTKSYAIAHLPGHEPDLVALFTQQEIRDITARSRTPHFFLETSAGLLEVRGAPLQPSLDYDRQTPPQGWFFVARRWDDKFLETIAHLNESDVRITAPDASPDFPEHPVNLRVSHVLRDAADQPLRVLHLDYHVDKLRRFVEVSTRNALPFLAYGVITIAIVVLALFFWVLRPLHLIGQSLSEDDPHAIQPLLGRTHELGRIARLVQTAAEQRGSLQAMLAERARLGRDLHDSVIQTIYACGMGVMSARLTLRTDPAASERTLDQISGQFNEIIHDLRSFIMGLEPEVLRHRTFRQALDGVIENFRSTHGVHLSLHIEEIAAERFSQPQQIHILHIVRECISNALRHGHATSITVSLRIENTTGIVEVVDNGRGFAPGSDPTRHGKGLTNLSERSTELAGQLVIESVPGQQTRVRVSIPLSSLAP